jgi:BatD DUF11 like domain
MTRIHTILAVLGTALMLAGTARAQDVSWENPGRLGAGQPAALTLVFVDTEPAGRIAPPQVDGLTVLGPPSQQSSISIVNGARSASLTLSFPVRAEREGTITIPSFEVDTSAGTLTVSALTLRVGAATLPGNGRRRAGAQLSDVVEARLTPTRMTPYAGEVFDVDVTVGLTAGSRGQVVGTPAWDKPGVIAEPWSEGKVVSIHNGSGVHFHTRAVAPQPGRIEVAPVQQDVEIDIGRARVDPFDGFGEAFARRFGGADLFDSFFSRTQTTSTSVRSNAVQLDVQPLPQPAPDGFSGAVGQFTIESNLVPAQPKTGEPVTWTVTLKGTGNWPGAVVLPARAVPNDFRTLQPKQHKDFASGELFSGALSEDLVMVPNQSGDYTLDPVRFVYFDPAKGQYQTIDARPPVLHITGAPIAAAPQSQPAVAPAPANRAPVAVLPSAAPAGRGPASGLLPHDPLRGTASAWAPIAEARLSQLAVVPFILLALYWVALAVRRARLTDPRRPQRQAFAQLAPAVERVRRAATAAERIAALLIWQHTVATALGLDVAAPTAAQLDDQRWIDVWAGSERALYGREHTLPGGWCDRALSVCTRARRPRFNPLRAFTMRNLVPKAATAALLLSLAVVTAPARAVETHDAYTNGDFAAAREQWLAGAQEAPSDWIARYNLGLAAAQLGDAPRALAETVAAFVHAPRNDDVRWNARAFAASVPGLDRATAALLSDSALAPLASPAMWQALLIGGALILCGGGALLLRRRYRPAPARSWVGAAALVAGIALGGTSALALRAYGPLADPQAALVAGQPVLRSVPTDAETAPQQKPLAAGTLVVVERDFLGWVKVGLRSGETGWLRHGDIVPLYAAPSA